MRCDAFVQSFVKLTVNGAEYAQDPAFEHSKQKLNIWSQFLLPSATSAKIPGGY